jgi:hypothetical protein
MEGWIKLYRSSLEHWLYIEKRPLTRREAWENMLMLVNHEDSKVLIHGNLVECKRGQSLQSLPTWADHFKWSVQKVRTFFKLLENDSMIVIEGLQKTTRLTICNYEKYQDTPTDKQQTDNRQITDKQQTTNRQITSNKNGKNIKKEKNGKNITLFFASPEFLPIWEKWIEYKKLIRKPYHTENGMVKKYNELVALSGNDPAKALLIVQQSIDEEWSGFFALKTNGRKVKQSLPGEDTVDKLLRDTMDILNKKTLTAVDGTPK